MIKFEIIGEPCGKGRHRASVVNGHIHTYTPEKTASYENLVKVMYLQQIGRKRLDGAIRAEITAYFTMAKAMAKKMKAETQKYGCSLQEPRPLKKPDCDNIAKIVLDSLNGLAYDDDKQVIELVVRKCYAQFEGEKSRVVVLLEEI